MILSIDVGINNLAVCCISKDRIVLWKSFDIVEKKEYLCTALKKDGEICNKKAKFTNSSLVNVCARHKDSIADEGTSRNKKKVKPIPKQKSLGIQSLCTNLIANLDTENWESFGIKEVIIEKQPLENKKMCMMSHFIYMYFVMKLDVPVKLIPAYHKLSVYDGPTIPLKYKPLKNGKIGYAERKYQSVQQTLHYLSTNEFKEWEGTFSGLKKKDDYADCFLQGLYYLKTGTPKTSLNFVKKKRKGKKLHF